MSLANAYLDRVVVNLYGGPGEAQAYLDDLTIGPVPESLAQTRPATDAPTDSNPAPPVAGTEPSTPGNPVRLDGGMLFRGREGWVPSILDAPGADLDTARRFGFDVLAVDLNDDPKWVQQAVQLGFLLMPRLAGARSGSTLDAEKALDAVATYPFRDSVAFWNLGEGLGASTDPEARQAELERVRAIVSGLRELPEGTPKLTTGVISGLFPQYAVPGQNLDLMGVGPHSWGSSMEPFDTFQYLQQRRNLTALWNLRAPYWAWVPVAAPSKVRSAVWGKDVPPAWGTARVQPEQVRVNTYLALMAGYRGVGFRGDAELTRDAGRPVLYELGLLNAEMDLVQSIVAQGAEVQALPTYPPDPKVLIQYNTSQTQSNFGNAGNTQIHPETSAHPTIRAASIATRDGRGRLVLIADMALHGQWQPPQMALHELNVVVPGVPRDAQAFELSLGEVRWLSTDRPPGGVRFTLPEFGVATMVLVTTDQQLIMNLKQAVSAIRPRAVDFAIRQARHQLETARTIHSLLENRGAKVRDSEDLLNLATKSLEAAESAYQGLNYMDAWDEAQRITRPLRILMRAHWDKSHAELIESAKTARDRSPGSGSRNRQVTTRPRSPESGPKQPNLAVPVVASPPLVAVQTLPQNDVWSDWIQGLDGYRFGRNLLESGTFDVRDSEALNEAGWSDAGYHYDRAEVKTATLLGESWSGLGLKLIVAAAGEEGAEAAVPFLDHMAAGVRTPPVRILAHKMARISVLVKFSWPIEQGGGGLIIRDSIGGEALQFRTTTPMPDWTEVVLFRRMPADGELTVTLGLAGYGIAEFDELRIELLEETRPHAPQVNPLAGDPSRRPAAPRSRIPVPEPSRPLASRPEQRRSTAAPAPASRPR